MSPNLQTIPSRPGITPWIQRLCSLTLLLFLAGCFSVEFISKYDEATDKGVTEFQKSVETFLVGLEQDGRPAGPLTEAEKTFFKKATVDLSVLAVRAAAIPKNDITQKMIANLADSMATLEALVPLGISKEQVQPIRSAINISIGAILQLELAKKRGDTKSK